MKTRYPDFANVNWNFEHDKRIVSPADALLIALMEFRAELQKINSVLACSNTLAIPKLLKSIEKNTRKKVKK
jgi:hypothetical protein